MSEAKPFQISKRSVWGAYKRVKTNRGAAGVDGETLAAFEEKLKDNPCPGVASCTPRR